MSSSAEGAGQLLETRGELEVEWRIADFLSLPQKVDEYLCSPRFQFSGASWYLCMYPDGESEDNSEGWIGLYLMRGDSGSPIFLDYTMYRKTAGGKKVKVVDFSRVFHKKDNGGGVPKYLSRSDLLQQKSELLPSGILTVTCSLKHNNSKNVTIPLQKRQQDVIDCLGKILTEQKRTDVVLQVKEQKFPAHRMILEARSPVFAAMFCHDTAENRTGVVKIDDVEPGALKQVLAFAYRGEIDEGMSFENVFDIYAAAEKYDFRDLKQLCKLFIDANLSEEWVCEVIQFAELYNEEETERLARNYLKDNAKKVLKTERWKEFSKKNHDFAIDLLSSAVTEVLEMKEPQ